MSPDQKGNTNLGGTIFAEFWAPLVANSRAGQRGGFKRGVSRSGLVLPFLSFFVLFRTFPSFSGFSRFALGLFGDFPVCPFSLSRPIQSAYEEQSRKGPWHNLDLSPKKSGKPPVWKPAGLASLNQPLPPTPFRNLWQNLRGTSSCVCLCLSQSVRSVSQPVIESVCQSGCQCVCLSV